MDRIPWNNRLTYAWKIISMAERVADRGFESDQGSLLDVAHRRKPIALAHSTIAAHFHAIRDWFTLEEFRQIAVHHGIIAPEDKDDCEPNP